jgi:signal transduction histidine kinase
LRTIDAIATPTPAGGQVRVVFGIGDSRLAKRLADEVGRFTSLDALACPASLEELRDTVTRTRPGAILLDDMFLGGVPLLESLCRLTEIAPVILLAPAARQAQAADLVAEGDLEFVVRVGDFVPLTVSLLERRVRWAERGKSASGRSWAELPEDIAEIFRHEINNPLTGILGNAELLLAHRDRMHATDAQRLETVVSLAVRLRETVRRLSNFPGMASIP